MYGVPMPAPTRMIFIGTCNIPVVCTPTCVQMARFTTATIISEGTAQPSGANMGVIQEGQIGDDVVVIQEFNASPEGEGFSWDTSHLFQSRSANAFAWCGFFRTPIIKTFQGSAGLSLLMLPTESATPPRKRIS